MDKFTRVRQSTKKLSFNLTLSIANFVMTMREYYNTTYISVLIFRIGLLLLVTTTITTTPIKTPPVEWSSRKISEGFWLQGLLPWPNVYKKSFFFKKNSWTVIISYFYCSSNKLCDKNAPIEWFCDVTGSWQGNIPV